MHNYSVRFLSVLDLVLELEQAAAQWLLAYLVVQPWIDGLYLVGVEFANIIDSDVVLELLSRLSSLLKEVRAKPDLLKMGLMWVLGKDLLDSHFSFTAAVDS